MADVDVQVAGPFRFAFAPRIDEQRQRVTIHFLRHIAGAKVRPSLVCYISRGGEIDADSR